jgi:hypothetical protein
MAEQRNWPLSFPVAAAVTAFCRVQYHPAGTVSHAGATEYGIGVAQKTQSTVGQEVEIRGYDQGTLKMVASGAIAAGAEVFAAAGGKIAATGTVKIGTARAAASGNNSIIEVIPHRGLIQSSSSSSSSGG